ncbi:Fur-regulated basic protein FbpA [Fictibacillus iocasae]|uniref:Fur-regulated basic protein FbpA n=1 Tax=Fictibacillus iocasae TaxID=2715437 RepID=A0ABW2NM31_9BACL
MSVQFRAALEKTKAYYIEHLLKAGVFKKDDRQLYHLTVSELSLLLRNRKGIDQTS